MNQEDPQLKELTTLRRTLHEHPELSGVERETAARIKAQLVACAPTRIVEEVGGHGIVGIFDSKKPGPTVLFRAELDALPIAEVNDLPYRSASDGVAHLCGHDGHASILIGLARRLTSGALPRGQVVLLFQPAEETGEGARAILDDPQFAGVHPDYVFALHNIPGYPLHEIIIREGSFTATVKSLVIRLSGKTAHAAEPEHGINPAMTIAEILTEMDALSNNDPGSEDFTVITPICVRMGEEAYGVSAGEAEVHLTLRTWNSGRMGSMVEHVEQVVNTIGQRHGVISDMMWVHPFETNDNDAGAVAHVQAAAETLGLSVTIREMPFKWGEDFGAFTQRWKGAMFGLGAGKDSPALHNPDYDFPDALIASGVNMFQAILQQILES